MTNYFLYVKIISMNNISYKSKKFYLIVLLCLLAIGCFAGVHFSRVSAQVSPITQSVFLPNKSSEVFDFNSSTPSDAVAFEQGYAVICKDNTLWISKGQDYSKLTLGNSNPAQVKKIAEDTLIVLDGSTLYKVNLNDLSYEILYYPDTQTPITGSSFDANAHFLVVRESTKVFAFELLNGVIQKKADYSIPYDASDLTPVAVDTLGRVFYIKNNQLFVCNGDTSNRLYTTHGEIKSIISDRTNLYFIEYFEENLSVNSISVEGGEKIQLSSSKSQYDLGYLVSPASLSFSLDGNLLITDSTVGAVQEFKPQGNELVFTGLAIAKDKTAFNRTSSQTVDVEIYCDNVAVLTDERIMIIKGKDFSAYNSDNFVNIFAEQLGGKLPDFFALGKDSVILANNGATASVNIYKYDQKSDNLISVEISNKNITFHDACYQSGYYYLLATSSNNVLVYKISEDTCEQVSLKDDYDLQAKPKFTVDVFGNVHIFVDTSIIKLASDLKGDIYALKADGFYKYNTQTELFELVFEPQNSKTLKSFSMCFDKKDVYFLYDGDEFIYKTSTLGNVAINGTAIPSDFITTSENAKESIKFFNPSEEENLYIVSTDGAFQFINLVDASHRCEQYVYVCSVDSLGYYLLASQYGLVLGYGDQTKLIEGETVMQDLSKTVYVATDVSAYYLPIITQGDVYAITVDSQKVRLAKTTELAVSKEFSYLDRTYYLVSYQLNGVTRSAYVPAEFTTNILSLDYVFTPFTIEKSQKVWVYSSSDLENKVIELKEGDTIRVYSSKNGVSLIRYFDGNEWLEGYISSSAIAKTPNTTIRNVLVILAVCACLCGTITYFLLRKKED